MSDDTATWKLIHAERAATADLLEGLAEEHWSQPSACGDWTVRVTAGHIVAGAEQTTGRFLGHMVTNGFRFNHMIDTDAKATAAAAPAEMVRRLRATTTTTNHPPAPVATMLGEVLVHTQDICRPLGLEADHATAALLACLDLYKTTSFPVGTKKRIAGLRLDATDLDWSHGDGPTVSGPSRSLLLTMTGRTVALDDLAGDGLATLRQRLA